MTKKHWADLNKKEIEEIVEASNKDQRKIMNTPTKQGWEKRFDKKFDFCGDPKSMIDFNYRFGVDSCKDFDKRSKNRLKNIKQFINTLLKQERAKVIGEIEENNLGGYIADSKTENEELWVRIDKYLPKSKSGEIILIDKEKLKEKLK